RVLRQMRIDARAVGRPEQADAIVALRSRADDTRLRRIVAATRLPVYRVKKNTTAQLRRLLQDLHTVVPGSDRGDVEEALREARAGVERAASQGVIVELAPRPARLRRLQHRVVVRRHMMAESVGSEPQRHLVIHPEQWGQSEG